MRKKSKYGIKKLILFLLISIVSGCQPERFTTKNGNVLEVSSLVGMNIFDLDYEYTKGSSETLVGTNNERWIVYFSDIDVTLETKKSTNIVQKANKGRKPKNSVWDE